MVDVRSSRRCLSASMKVAETRLITGVRLGRFSPYHRHFARSLSIAFGPTHSSLTINKSPTIQVPFMQQRMLATRDARVAHRHENVIVVRRKLYERIKLR